MVYVAIGLVIVEPSEKFQSTHFSISLLLSIFLHSEQEELKWTTSTTFPVSTEIAATTASVADHPHELHEASIVTPMSIMVSSSSSKEQSTPISPFENLNSFTSRAARFKLSSSNNLVSCSIFFV